MLSKEQKKRIIKAYFGQYADKPTLEVTQRMVVSKFNQTESALILAPSRYHKQIICHTLILGGHRKNYRVMLSHELIDIYLGNSEEYSSVMQVQVPYLFILALRAEMPNIQRWNIISQTVWSRGVKPTYVISDMNREWYPEGVQIVDFKGIKSKKEEIF